MRHFSLRLLFVVSTVLLTCVAPEVRAADDLYVIVNKQNPATSLSAAELRDYYFKRRRNWPDGTGVRFIDAAEQSSARKIFLSKYLGRSAKDVSLYWIGQRLYSGDSAPLQESSEAMIAQFVGSLKGAIGYIADPAAIAGNEVKTVKIDSEK